MTSAIQRATLAGLAWCFLLAGCSGSPPRKPAKEYQLRGEIMGLDAGGHVATIKHEEIKGFMGAMTMGYPIKDASKFGKLSVGEPITATVYVTDDEMWVGNIQKDSSAPKPAQ
jgi:Cu/Ag efflux protein CusF